MSPINLVVAACLARLLGEGQSGAEPVAVTLEPADLPAPLPAMPGMVPAAPLTPGESAAVLSGIRTCRGTSPQMVGFGTLILESLPED